MSFISDCENKLELFKMVHGRSPVNGEEFAKWCDTVDSARTLNSRGPLSYDPDYHAQQAEDNREL